MSDMNPLNMADNLHSLEVLLCAAMEMDWRKADESEIAGELIEIAIQRCRRLLQKPDGVGVKNA
ncbi:hypothetical protein NGC52_22560 [Klebsiella michiganensis]|uniref:hypothetical protein n=1 Tax=Klebsiella TaxID=570 RepID=UPI0007CA171E|nr:MULTISPECIES: hypothetical protein [Klebsiella]HBM9092694.1 hypothetical protein [Klebsiella oxytoca]ELA0892665.1 hypothetical protein [Klebsiella pneumoniae]MBF7795410.1 hypothetical protein [Klebsiella pneumoniae]MBF7799751.1 hypothetical protein [Klebsiella pneumoniae]MEB7682518.1 hypothetical protein [Klebsiella michiganensis]